MSELSECLSTLPTVSTKHMEQDERETGIQTMLDDLFMLADRDGCISAAWALEMLAELNRKLESAEYQIDHLRLEIEGLQQAPQVKP